jgi:hypothetical protein
MNPSSPSTYQVVFPDYFDGEAGEIRAKGYFADLVVVVGDRHIRPTIMTPHRLARETEIEFAEGKPCYFESNVVLVPEISRERINAAMAELSRSGFDGLCAADQ